MLHKTCSRTGGRFGGGVFTLYSNVFLSPGNHTIPFLCVNYPPAMFFRDYVRATADAQISYCKCWKMHLYYTQIILYSIFIASVFLKAGAATMNMQTFVGLDRKNSALLQRTIYNKRLIVFFRLWETFRMAHPTLSLCVNPREHLPRGCELRPQ